LLLFSWFGWCALVACVVLAFWNGFVELVRSGVLVKGFYRWRFVFCVFRGAAGFVLVWFCGGFVGGLCVVSVSEVALVS
jgi:hypothetical protein